MAGRGFQHIGNPEDPKELRKLNDQLYMLWHKVLGRIEGADIDLENFSIDLGDIDGGTLTLGGAEGGSIQIRDGAGVSIGELGEDGIQIDADRLVVKNDTDYEVSLIGERNFCGDHSFECVAHEGTEDGTHHDFAMSAPSAGQDRWEIDAGTPRVLDDAAGSDTSQRYAWFGKQAVACNSANSVRYIARIDAARNTYTVSVHAWPHYSRNAQHIAVHAQIEAVWLDAGLSVVQTESTVQQTLTSYFSPGTSGRIYCGCRFSHTYARPDTARYMEIKLFSPGSGEWVCFDGVQIVSGDRMALYQPEDGLWHTM
jgi:hypothetical protein